MNLPSTLCSRQINEADIPAVAALLARGFPRHSCQFWLRALDKLRKREPPPGSPKYGYLMECSAIAVGVILLICSTMPANGKLAIRCNLSSWYFEPKFRPYASLLRYSPVSQDDVTYLNISPNPHTWPIIKAQGFLRYCDGVFVAAPLLEGSLGGPRVKIFSANRRPDVMFDPYDQNLMIEHASFGCTSLWCTTPERAYPFVFRRCFVRRIIPCAQLIYCRDISELVRFAGPIGRFLAFRGIPLVMVDANGPVSGLVGVFREGPRKYYKGPCQPRLGDLSYTERAIWGA